MVGQWMRLNRLFSQGERAVIVSATDDEFIGSPGTLMSVPEVTRDLADADAILLSPGLLRHCGHAFDYRGAPLAIVRLDWHTTCCTAADYDHTAAAEVISPRRALAMGADLALATLSLTQTDAAADTAGIAMFSRFAHEKRECGLPLLGELCPPGAANMVAEQLFEQVHVGCRILAELGADVVIGIFTGERFAETVAACPVPVLATIQNPAIGQRDALQLAYQAVKAGARGVVFGRQATGAPNRPAFLAALNAVVKEETDPDAAAEQFTIR